MGLGKKARAPFKLKAIEINFIYNHEKVLFEREGIPHKKTIRTGDRSPSNRLCGGSDTTAPQITTFSPSQSLNRSGGQHGVRNILQKLSQSPSFTLPSLKVQINGERTALTLSLHPPAAY